MQLKRQWLPMDGCVDLLINGYLGTDFSAPGLQLTQVRSMVEGLRDRGTIARRGTTLQEGRHRQA